MVSRETGFNFKKPDKHQYRSLRYPREPDFIAIHRPQNGQRKYSMAYKVYISEDGKYIVTKHVGNINSQLILQRTLEAHALGNTLGITRHLMDVREATNCEPLSTTYNFAYRDVRNTPGININAKVAVLVRPGDHSHDFAEIVTNNAGQNIKLFTDRESAIKHLLT